MAEKIFGGRVYIVTPEFLGALEALTAKFAGDEVMAWEMLNSPAFANILKPKEVTISDLIDLNDVSGEACAVLLANAESDAAKAMVEYVASRAALDAATMALDLGVAWRQFSANTRESCLTKGGTGAFLLARVYVAPGSDTAKAAQAEQDAHIKVSALLAPTIIESAKAAEIDLTDYAVSVVIGPSGNVRPQARKAALPVQPKFKGAADSTPSDSSGKRPRGMHFVSANGEHSLVLADGTTVATGKDEKTTLEAVKAWCESIGRRYWITAYKRMPGWPF